MNEYLRQHPNIFMSPIKDVNFFGSDLKFKFHNHKRDQNYYLSLFSEARHEKRLGEAFVWYLYSKQAAKEIKELNPLSIIIIMLRNPVDMLYSLHSHFFLRRE